MNLAVLIIAYSRPEGISYLLKTLNSSGIRDVYIAIDGPRNARDKVNHEKINIEISKYLNQARPKIHVHKRVQNLGVAGGVLNAVDWFFSCEKMGLILEDDLRISSDLFEFSDRALKVYESDPDVWMISGTQLFPNFVTDTQIIWSNYPMIWGWAGWAEKWHIMRESLLGKKHIGLRRLFNRRYLYWAVGGNRALAGKVDTWDTPLAFEFWNQNKLCLMPPVNLVSNVGDDDVSTNTKIANSSMKLGIQTIEKGYDLANQSDKTSIKSYNALLEKRVFKIKWRHIFLPYFSYIYDHIKFPHSKRRLPLGERNDWLES
jgi:hypothetical protein